MQGRKNRRPRASSRFFANSFQAAEKAVRAEYTSPKSSAAEKSLNANNSVVNATGLHTDDSTHSKPDRNRFKNADSSVSSIGAKRPYYRFNQGAKTSCGLSCNHLVHTKHDNANVASAQSHMETTRIQIICSADQSAASASRPKLTHQMGRCTAPFHSPAPSQGVFAARSRSRWSNMDTFASSQMNPKKGIFSARSAATATCTCSKAGAGGESQGGKRDHVARDQLSNDSVLDSNFQSDCNCTPQEQHVAKAILHPELPQEKARVPRVHQVDSIMGNVTVILTSVIGMYACRAAREILESVGAKVFGPGEWPETYNPADGALTVIVVNDLLTFEDVQIMCTSSQFKSSLKQCAYVLPSWLPKLKVQLASICSHSQLAVGSSGLQAACSRAIQQSWYIEEPGIAKIFCSTAAMASKCQRAEGNGNDVSVGKRDDEKIQSFVDDASNSPSSEHHKMQSDKISSHQDIHQDSSLDSSLEDMPRVQQSRLSRDRFACQKGLQKNNLLHPEHVANMSQADFGPTIIDMLQTFKDNYTAMGEPWKEKAYGTAIAIVKSRMPITDVEAQLKSVPKLGKSIFSKIDQLISSGRCEKLEYMKHSKELQVCHRLSKVWGIGPKLARQFFQQGVESLEQLKGCQDLPERARVALEYTEQINSRCKREDISSTEFRMREALAEITDTIRMQVTGSYRRLKDSSGDMDVLVAPVSGTAPAGFFAKLVTHWENKDILKVRLTYGCGIYMGLGNIGGELRRIDVKLYTAKQFPFALLYFTGSGYFNRSMRLWANKHGFSLSDKGLVAKQNGTEVEIPCKDEEDIFKQLGLRYVDPEHREGEPQVQAATAAN